MPTIRKLSPEETADWDLEIAPFALDAMLDRIAGSDRRGLTRIDRPGAAGGEHGAQRAPPGTGLCQWR